MYAEVQFFTPLCLSSSSSSFLLFWHTRDWNYDQYKLESPHHIFWHYFNKKINQVRDGISSIWPMKLRRPHQISLIFVLQKLSLSGCCFFTYFRGNLHIKMHDYFHNFPPFFHCFRSSVPIPSATTFCRLPFRHTDRQADRQTDRQTGRQSN